MVIAFWNINNNTDLGDLLIDLIKENSIDILLLAEADINPKRKRKCIVDDILLDFITKSKFTLKDYKVVPNGDFRIKVLTRLSLKNIKLKRKNITSSRWTSFSINIPGKIEFNLFPVHFYSKVNWSENSLALECVNFSRDIFNKEIELKCFNSILIGDFNMNPFEQGVVASNGINALQDLDYLKNNLKGREIDGTNYRYFYNPMWNYFGDNQKPYGTIYHRTSQHVSYEWNLFDQVMIRPEMYNYLNKDSVSIITKIAGYNLLKKYNRPEKKYSDHLPIILKLNL